MVSCQRKFRRTSTVYLILLVFTVQLAGCASSGNTVAGEQSGPGVTASVATGSAPVGAKVKANRQLNQKLIAAASRQPADSDSAVFEYRIGPGDILEIAVFDVEELNVKVRVNGRGSIIVPLLGEVPVGGKTASESERVLTQRLGKDYIHDPQVSVFVAEYRSQEIGVSGAVKNPSVFFVDKPRTILQMLTMAGGLSDTASHKINVQTTTRDPDGDALRPQSLIVDIRDLLKNNELSSVVLGAGDSIFVPEAGTIFVEGAVATPGSYPIQGESNVLKAVALAGGTSFDAIESEIQVIRADALGEPEFLTVNLDKVRANEATDLALADGDVVLVKSNKLTKGFVIFWKEFTRLINPFSA